MIQELAIQAIASRNLLQFTYDDKPRVIEVHAVGLTSKGEAIRGFQLNLEPPGWRLFTTDKIIDPILTNTSLSQAPRPGYALDDKQMVTIFAQVPNA